MAQRRYRRTFAAHSPAGYTQHQPARPLQINTLPSDTPTSFPNGKDSRNALSTDGTQNHIAQRYQSCGPTLGTTAHRSLSKTTARPLRVLDNPDNLRYMNIAVHGLVWGALRVGGLDATERTLYLVSFNHCWLTERHQHWLCCPMDQLQGWGIPFSSMTWLTLYTIYLLPKPEPISLSCKWEARLKIQMRTVIVRRP